MPRVFVLPQLSILAYDIAGGVFLAFPRNSQTQSGPGRTSAKDNKARSAAGRLREPGV